jgi:hypothetical protein
LVDIRPEYPGRDYSLFGEIKLRSFNVVLSFLTQGISEHPEFDVAPDLAPGRSGGIPGGSWRSK